jgi:hypothetical protein
VARDFLDGKGTEAENLERGRGGPSRPKEEGAN